MIDSHCHLADEAFADDLDSRDRAGAGRRAQRCALHSFRGRRQRVGRGGEGPRVVAGGPVLGRDPPAQGGGLRRPARAGAHGRRGRVSPRKAHARLARLASTTTTISPPGTCSRPCSARQVRLALELALPVIIHTREATDDTFGILREAGPSLRGVFHCFTGDRGMARDALDLGFYVSLAGIVTFPRGRGVARRSRRSCPPTASSSRPTRRIWRPSRTAGSGTSRRLSVTWPRRLPPSAAFRPRSWARRWRGTSRHC